MCQFLVSIDWVKAIEAIATILTLYVAYSALHTWKDQSKAQKQTDFLDELTDAVYEYKQTLSRPYELLKFVFIGVESHRPTPDGTLEQGAVAYIEARGKDVSKRMWEYLEPSAKLVSKIEVLVVRGQAYGFTQYDQCLNSIQLLRWQYQRLQVVASILENTDLNWSNPLVQKSVANMLSVQPEDIARHLEENGLKFIEFVKVNYQRIYAGT